MSHSTSYYLIFDRLARSKNQKFYTSLSSYIFRMRRPELRHSAQFKSWQRSSRFRFQLESWFVILMTILLQLYVSDFNKEVSLGAADLHDLIRHAQVNNSEAFDEVSKGFGDRVQQLKHDLRIILFVCIDPLFYPVSFLLTTIFLAKTGRTKLVQRYSFLTLVCFIQFAASCFMVQSYLTFEQSKHKEVQLVTEKMQIGLGAPEGFVTQMIYAVAENDTRFDQIIATVVICQWIRLVNYLKVTSLFGPTYVMLVKMTGSVVSFLITWFTLLLIFSFAS